MESRLSSSSSGMKSMKISMESERMFGDMEEEVSGPSPTSRDMRRSSSRTMSPSQTTSSMSGAARVSVKDQLYALECKVQSHEDTIQKLMAIHQADKALLMSKIDEITERTGEELYKLRVDYQKKLNAASDEIERLNKCLNVQRGHITTLQEQCQSLHKHVVQVDDDVTKLATEVLGE
jgi:chromosome segregation ATPase